MSGDADSTPQSGKRPRLGLGRRACLSTPLLKLPKEESSVKTPKTENLETPKTFPLSLSARRVGLSKNRTELSKKRLEFANAHEVMDPEPSVSQERVKKSSKKETKKDKRKKQEEIPKPVDKKGKKAGEGISKEQAPLKKAAKDRVPPKEDVPEQDQDQDQESPKSDKILELHADIEIWRKGFIASVEDLQSMVEPRLTKKELLLQLGIPLAMLRYLDED
ncbi:hypothetical protein KR009_002743 [Drosophila setifemur]|nr:hypothetical protein KR009_002743 [Drosophila setifemur]